MNPTSPFERGGRAARLGRLALLIGAPLLAVVFVRRERRDTTPAPAATGGHDMSAMQGGRAPADSAQPLALSGEQARRIGVTFAPVSTDPLQVEVRVVAQVVVDERRVATIPARVDGWVETMHVNTTGAPVAAGDPLLDLHSPMLVTAQEELLVARRLVADLAGASEDARNRARDLESAARRRLAFWEVDSGDIARVERTGTVQRTLTLRAPGRGIVLDKLVLPGQRVMAGDPLYRIADLTRVWFEGEIFEQDLPLVRVGQRATATLEALPGESWAGTIALVYPTVDPTTRTARVRVEVSNPQLRLKPGMFATLQLDTPSRPGLLSVPRGAVLQTGQRTLVFLRRADGRLEPRPVVTGSATAERIEIRSGLRPGDMVVASATFLLDAESSLGTAMGGMGDMPGMDMTAPAPVPPSPRK